MPTDRGEVCTTGEPSKETEVGNQHKNRPKNNKRKATEDLNIVTNKRFVPPRNQNNLKGTGTPIPKVCYKEQCLHDIIFGRHFNYSDLNKGYGGVCPECGEKPKSESKNSKTPRSSLMKTHLFFQCSIYKYGQKYKPL